MILNFIDTIEGWMQPVKDWIFEHNNSVWFWIGAFVIGLAIFFFTFKALNKDK